MSRNKKVIAGIVGGLLLLTAGALAALPAGTAAAQGLFHGGRGGPGGHEGPGGEAYLAEALGITVEELQAAQTAAWEAAVDQALEDGLITEAQATRLKAQGAAPHGRGRGMLVFLAGDKDAFDFDTLLAEQLGMSVEELSAARDEAFELTVQAGLDSGQLSEEQAELMRAHHALKDYIDHEALLAGALGISPEDLQAAREQGKRPPEQSAAQRKW